MGNDGGDIPKRK